MVSCKVSSDRLEEASEITLGETRVPSWDEVVGSILQGYMSPKSTSRAKLYNLFLSEYYRNQPVSHYWWNHEVVDIKPLQWT